MFAEDDTISDKDKQKISKFLFGRPEPPGGMEYIFSLYLDLLDDLGGLDWTKEQETFLSMIQGICKKAQATDHAGLRIALLQSAEGLFEVIKIMIQEENRNKASD